VTQQVREYELLPCIYEKREVQQKYAVKIIDNAINYLRKNIYEWLKWVQVMTEEGLPVPKNPKSRIDGDFSYSLGDLIIRLSSILKDKSFEEEAEWRLVSKPIPDILLSHRSRGPIIVLYDTFKLVQELPEEPSDQQISQKGRGFGPIAAIKEVWIGPGSEREKRLSAQTLAGLFRKHQIPLDFDEEGKTIKNIKITDTTFSKSM
jgi:hypothetical protein